MRTGALLIECGRFAFLFSGGTTVWLLRQILIVILRLLRVREVDVQNGKRWRAVWKKRGK
jgi:hypothetical protein